MSVPYPVDESQHLQIPDPDTKQYNTHSSHHSTPFVNPHQSLPYPPPQSQELPYPAHQSLPGSQEEYYGENFRESVGNLQLNEGLQDLGKNLLKQGNSWKIFLVTFIFDFV